MAFKRSNFSSLRNTRKENFESAYKLSKKVKFEKGSDVYAIPLGLETGYYETFCHRVIPHKVEGQLIGFGGVTFGVNIKCNGIDEEGNVVPSLCCSLASKEKERFPESDDYAKRLVSTRTSRVHLPILILGNSLNDDSRMSYPISKVSILNDLKSSGGLKFSFLDMSASVFKSDIILAFGKKLKEDGKIDYELDENSEEFFEAVRERLINTVIKIHGVEKKGFNAPLKEYSFFPFNNDAIAAGSPEGEREAIINYKEHPEIMAKVDEYLQLFNVEVDSLVRNWKEKDLQEYYNSAIGVALKAEPKKEEVKEQEPEETVEVISAEEEYDEEPQGTPPSDDEVAALIANPFKDSEDMVSKTDDDLDSFEYDMEEDESFFEE